MAEILTREAQIEDANAIAGLGRVTFTETFGHLFRDQADLDTYLVKTFSEEKIRSSLEKSGNVFWISFVNNIPAGYAKLKIRSGSPFIDSENTAQLQKIYVLKEYLDKKIGLSLQSKLIEKARQSGAEFIWLSVLESNEKAIRFYTQNGFTKAGQHDFSIGKEQFLFDVMTKKLEIL